MPKTTFQLFWKNCEVEPHFRAGVSLHSHTLYSEETLDGVSQHLSRLPYLGGRILRHACFDFANGYWTPPLAARRAYELEERQIHRRFHLPALVSLSDHDDIRAGTLLRVLERFRDVPVSTEWTIFFGSTFFHLGVHNLPASFAQSITAELALLNARGGRDLLVNIFEFLNTCPDILIVLNHPLWDEKGVGRGLHTQIVRRLLERHARSIHALEVNGLRPWDENMDVMRLGLEFDLPVVSGGDRHGLEPNSVLNLTRADTFAEFVHEVRQQRRSHVVFMPQYREHHKARIVRMIADVLGEYPEMPGRETWADRVFVRCPVDGNPEPVSSLVNGYTFFPNFVSTLAWVLRTSKWRGIRWALGFALRATPLIGLK